MPLQRELDAKLPPYRYKPQLDRRFGTSLGNTIIPLRAALRMFRNRHPAIESESPPLDLRA